MESSHRILYTHRLINAFRQLIQANHFIRYIGMIIYSNHIIGVSFQIKSNPPVKSVNQIIPSNRPIIKSSMHPLVFSSLSLQTPAPLPIKLFVTHRVVLSVCILSCLCILHVHLPAWFSDLTFEGQCHISEYTPASPGNWPTPLPEIWGSG